MQSRRDRKQPEPIAWIRACLSVISQFDGLVFTCTEKTGSPVGPKLALSLPGSHNNYEKDGEEIYALAFTCEEIDYLDSKVDSEARRTRTDGGPASQAQPDNTPAKANSRGREGRAESQSTEAAPV